MPTIAEPARTIVLIGLFAVPLVLISGFFLGEYRPDRTGRIRRAFKLATSLILVLCAALVWLSNPRLVDAAPTFFFGMTFGFFGDLIMAGLIRVPNRLIFGIVAFSLGHICYIAGFTLVAQVLGLSNPWASPAWIGFVIGAAVLWAALVRSPSVPRVLNVGSLIYAGLIGVMAGVAAGLALQDARFWPTAIGSFLFLLSDVILGNCEFRDNSWFLVHDVIWVIYIGGQALIVLTGARV
jgi:hypothetical protein